MSKSIVSNERICLVCSTTHNLHKHHIFYGTGKRMLSEKYGCWCYLCGVHHNLSIAGVHFNKALDNELKEMDYKPRFLAVDEFAIHKGHSSMLLVLWILKKVIYYGLETEEV